MRFSFIKILAFLLVAVALNSCHTAKKASAGKGKGHKTERVVKTGNLKGLEKKIVEEALTWEGTPYKYGASQKGKGTDCSGVVVGVYSKVTDKKLPRNSAQQADFCKNIKRKQVRPGDLVFFATGKDKHKISHVGIMVDDDRFIHASTKKGVIISDLETPYYQRTFIQFGRVP